MHRDLKSPYQWNTEHDSPWQQVGKKALILLFLPSGVGSCQGNSIFESNLMKRVENNLELRSCSKDMSLSQSCLNTSFTHSSIRAQIPWTCVIRKNGEQQMFPCFAAVPLEGALKGHWQDCSRLWFQFCSNKHNTLHNKTFGFPYRNIYRKWLYTHTVYRYLKQQSWTTELGSRGRKLLTELTHEYQLE